MPSIVVATLIGTWLLVAYQVYQAGNGTLALLLVLVSLALAVWRTWRN
jgi:hypothetical protein